MSHTQYVAGYSWALRELSTGARPEAIEAQADNPLDELTSPDFHAGARQALRDHERLSKLCGPSTIVRVP